MNVNDIVVNGKVYRLQHPGNREWIKLQSKLCMIKDGQTIIDIEKMFDYCFEHVVYPNEGNKLNLDTLPLKELEAWQIILPSFLRGELVTGYTYPEDSKSQKTGAKLLQKVQETVPK